VKILEKVNEKTTFEDELAIEIKKLSIDIWKMTLKTGYPARKMTALDHGMQANLKVQS
jgi:hypothetical protein